VSLVVSKPSIDIGIVLDDVDAMIRFYRDVLGLPELGVFPVPGGVQHRYALGDSIIKLVVPDVAPGSRAPGGQLKEATGIRDWTAVCKQLDATVEACIAAGASVLTPLNVSPSGIRYAVLTDPDGNGFELIES
jgi:catechol 2,3-dioxygenase-like lactoylglutathione lyase family enzyme